MKLLYYWNEPANKIGFGPATDANLKAAIAWAAKSSGRYIRATVVKDTATIADDTQLSFVRVGEPDPADNPQPDLVFLSNTSNDSTTERYCFWLERPSDDTLRVLPFNATFGQVLRAKSVRHEPTFWGFAPTVESTTVTDTDDTAIDTPATNVSPPAATVPAPTPVLDRTTRLIEDEAAARRAGWAPAPPVYALGTPIIDYGKNRWKTGRREWEKTPPTVEGLTAVIQRVAEERREDRVVRVSELSMDTDGHLVVGGERYAIETLGMKQLLTRIKNGDFEKPTEDEKIVSQIVEELQEEYDDSVGRTLFPSAFDLMSAVDPDLRASVFNTQVRRHGDASQKLKLRLRSRTDAAMQQMYSVVGPNYTTFDADKVSAALRNCLYKMNGGRQARGEVLYDPSTTRLKVNALWHADLPYDGGSAGDFFKGGIVGYSNDAGGGGVSGNGQLWRNLCLNLIIVNVAKKSLFRITHRSSADEIAKAINEGMKQAEKDFAYFLQRWGILHATPIKSVRLWGEQFVNVEEAIKWAVENGRITAGVGKDVLTEALLNSYAAEPGDNLEALINAMTRTHDDKYSKLVQSAVESLEQQAGELVMVLARSAESQM